MFSETSSAGASGGHSLIELVVTLAIIGLALSLAAPALRGPADASSPPAVAAVAALLRGVSYDAGATGSTYTLVLDIETATFWLLRSVGSDEERLLRSGSIDRGPDVRFASRSERALWRFAPGRLPRADTLTIRDGAEGWRVLADPLSGLVTIEEVR